jgi:hypothetical protein
MTLTIHMGLSYRVDHTPLKQTLTTVFDPGAVTGRIRAYWVTASVLDTGPTAVEYVVAAPNGQSTMPTTASMFEY